MLRVYTCSGTLTELERRQLRDRADHFLTTAAMLEREGDLPAAIAARNRADFILASASYVKSVVQDAVR